MNNINVIVSIVAFVFRKVASGSFTPRLWEVFQSQDGVWFFFMP